MSTEAEPIPIPPELPWHALTAMVLGYNKLAQSAPTLGEKVYFASLRDEYKKVLDSKFPDVLEWTNKPSENPPKPEVG